MGRKITIIIILLVTAVLIGWDLVVIYNDEQGDTISEVIWTTARDWTVLAYAFGCLMGHFFFPRVADEAGWKWHTSIGYLAACGSAPLLVDVAWDPGYTWLPLVTFAYGFACGHLLWPNGEPETHQ